MTASAPEAFQLASRSRRAIARSLDSVLFFCVFLAVAEVIARLSAPSPDGTGIVLVAMALTFCLYLAHEVVVVGLTGRSFGKVLTGLRVTRFEEDRKPGIGRAALRAFLPASLLIFFALAYPLVYLVGLFTPDGRVPNDALARTRVVRTVRTDATTRTVVAPA